MIKYSITESGVITEFADLSEAQAYKESKSIAEEIVSVEFTPASDRVIPPVTPRQIRQALILSGVSLSSIDAALGSLAEPTRSLALAEWDYSVSFHRDRPLVASVAEMLGWTSQQLDDLWLFAGTL